MGRLLRSALALLAVAAFCAAALESECPKLDCECQTTTTKGDCPVCKEIGLIACFVNPCDVNKCPAFPNAKCQKPKCGDACDFEFVDEKGNPVDCEITTTEGTSTSSPATSDVCRVYRTCFEKYTCIPDALYQERIQTPAPCAPMEDMWIKPEADTCIMTTAGCSLTKPVENVCTRGACCDVTDEAHDLCQNTDMCHNVKCACNFGFDENDCKCGVTSDANGCPTCKLPAVCKATEFAPCTLENCDNIPKAQCEFDKCTCETAFMLDGEDVTNDCQEDEKCYQWRNHCGGAYQCGDRKTYDEWRNGPQPDCWWDPSLGDAYVKPADGSCERSDTTGVCDFSLEPVTLNECLSDCCDEESLGDRVEMCRDAGVCDDCANEKKCAIWRSPCGTRQYVCGTEAEKEEAEQIKLDCATVAATYDIWIKPEADTCAPSNTIDGCEFTEEPLQLPENCADACCGMDNNRDDADAAMCEEFGVCDTLDCPTETSTTTTTSSSEQEDVDCSIACCSLNDLVGRAVCIANGGCATVFCESVCGENEKTGCASCDPTCKDPNPFCITLACADQCTCRPGYVREESSNKCVSVETCSVDTTCGDNEQLGCKSCESTCEDRNPFCLALACRDECRCKTGFVRNADGKCVSDTTCKAATCEIYRSKCFTREYMCGTEEEAAAYEQQQFKCAVYDGYDRWIEPKEDTCRPDRNGGCTFTEDPERMPDCNAACCSSDSDSDSFVSSSDDYKVCKEAGACLEVTCTTTTTTASPLTTTVSTSTSCYQWRTGTCSMGPYVCGSKKEWNDFVSIPRPVCSMMPNEPGTWYDQYLEPADESCQYLKEENKCGFQPEPVVLPPVATCKAVCCGSDDKEVSQEDEDGCKAVCAAEYLDCDKFTTTTKAPVTCPTVTCGPSCTVKVDAHGCEKCDCETTTQGSTNTTPSSTSKTSTATTPKPTLTCKAWRQGPCGFGSYICTTQKYYDEMKDGPFIACNIPFREPGTWYDRHLQPDDGSCKPEGDDCVFNPSPVVLPPVEVCQMVCCDKDEADDAELSNSQINMCQAEVCAEKLLKCDAFTTTTTATTEKTTTDTITSECPVVTCSRECVTYKKTQQGCETCECEESTTPSTTTIETTTPKCPPVTCSRECITYKKTQEGCETCECEQGTTTETTTIPSDTCMTWRDGACGSGQWRCTTEDVYEKETEIYKGIACRSLPLPGTWYDRYLAPQEGSCKKATDVGCKFDPTPNTLPEVEICQKVCCTDDADITGVKADACRKMVCNTDLLDCGLFTTTTEETTTTTTTTTTSDQKCLPGEIYSQCKVCEQTCESLGESVVCDKSCGEPGCYCKEGFVRTEKGCEKKDVCDDVKPLECKIWQEAECATDPYVCGTLQEYRKMLSEPRAVCSQAQFPRGTWYNRYLQPKSDSCVPNEDEQSCSFDPEPTVLPSVDTCREVCCGDGIVQDGKGQILTKTCNEMVCEKLLDCSAFVTTTEQPRCPDENQVFDTCGSSCPTTCANRFMEIGCTDDCNAGCFCKNGYVRNADGDCIREEDCPPTTTPQPSECVVYRPSVACDEYVCKTRAEYEAYIKEGNVAACSASVDKTPYDRYVKPADSTCKITNKGCEFSPAPVVLPPKAVCLSVCCGGELSDIVTDDMQEMCKLMVCSSDMLVCPTSSTAGSSSSPSKPSSTRSSPPTTEATTKDTIDETTKPTAATTKVTTKDATTRDASTTTAAPTTTKTAAPTTSSPQLNPIVDVQRSIILSNVNADDVDKVSLQVILQELLELQDGESVEIVSIVAATSVRRRRLLADNAVVTFIIRTFTPAATGKKMDDIITNGQLLQSLKSTSPTAYANASVQPQVEESKDGGEDDKNNGNTVVIVAAVVGGVVLIAIIIAVAYVKTKGSQTKVTFVEDPYQPMSFQNPVYNSMANQQQTNSVGIYDTPKPNGSNTYESFS